MTRDAIAGKHWYMRFPVAPWTAGFIGAVAVLGVSVVYLAVVLADVTGSNGTDAAPPGRNGGPAATATPPDEEETAILFEGTAPDTVLLPEMRRAAAGEQADLRFGAETADTEIAMGYYVPVVAQWTGIDALSSDDLVSVLSGTATSWAQVGGLDVAVQFFAVEGSTGSEIAQGIAPGAAPDQTFDSYEALLEALTPDSGAIAFIPLDRLTVAVSAVGVGGIDIARGYGDVASWPYVEQLGVEALTDRGEAVLERIASFQLEPPAVTSVIATGDFLPVRCSLARIEASGDWASPFRGEMGEYMRSADLTLSSLDSSIQSFAEPFRCVGTVNLTAPPPVLEALTYAGVDAVTIATNHVFDCGQMGWCGADAFLETLENLDAYGIEYVGGGRNLEEALAPGIFERNGITFGVLGFDDIAAMDLGATEDSPGTAPMDDDYSQEREWGEAAFFAPAEWLGVERLQERVAALKEEVDFVIVLVQTGTEDTHLPSARSIKGLRAAVDAGADLVIGNQAHHVQAAEVRNGSFIGYALGNFVYDQVHTIEHTQCYLAEASFWEDRLAAMRLVGCQIMDMYRPVLVDRQTELKILGDVYEASAWLAEQGE